MFSKIFQRAVRQTAAGRRLKAFRFSEDWCAFVCRRPFVLVVVLVLFSFGVFIPSAESSAAMQPLCPGRGQDAIRRLFDDMLEGDEELGDMTGNLQPLLGIWSDYPTPIIRRGEKGVTASPALPDRSLGSLQKGCEKMRCDPPPADPFALALARVHEAEGPGRRSFALLQAARRQGPLVWVVPSHAPHQPMLRGLPEGVGRRMYVIRPANEVDLLWAVEEALRSSGVGLVIAEPEKPLSFITGRRLQLAAEAGRTTGLMLIRENQGSNAAETRWRCAPMAGEDRDSTLHHWSLNKNKKGTLESWTVHWNGKTAAVHLVSAAGERRGASETSR